MIVAYIDEHREKLGVEPICEVLATAGLQVAPSTYYAARGRAPSVRAVNDERLKVEIARVHADNYSVYGIGKVHAQLGRDGVAGLCDPDGSPLHDGRPVARCTTERLMRQLGLRGVSRSKGPRTTVAGSDPDQRRDLVERHFAAPVPDCLWVADIERHEAFTNPAVVKGHRHSSVAAGVLKLEDGWLPRRGGGWWSSPRQRRVVPALPDGAGSASEMERHTRGTSV